MSECVSLVLSAYKPPKVDLPEDVHKKVLDARLEEQLHKLNRLQLLYRARLMQELDLHVPTHPLQVHPHPNTKVDSFSLSVCSILSWVLMRDQLQFSRCEFERSWVFCVEQTRL